MGFGINTESNPPIDVKPTASIPAVTGDHPAVTPVVERPIQKPDDELSERKYVTDTFHNKTAVNVGRFPQVINDLKGFAEGSSVKVTYYKEHYSETDIHGREHTEESTHAAHKSVLKIYNLEMRMTGPLQYTHDTDEKLNKMEGEAYTYPGFEPECGDKFVLEISPGTFGWFEILTPPTRMSIRASTYFKISFSFVDYFTEELKKLVEPGVVATAYFDKLRFLNEPGALLMHDEVVEMKFMEKQRKKMIHYFNTTFLDNQIMYSYMRPDGVYDPYVTDFLMNILEMGELPTSVLQLYSGAPNLNNSIWKAFLDENMPLESVPSSTKIVKHVLGSKSVLHNSLINRNYTSWIKSQSLKDYIDGLINSGSSGETPSGEIPPNPSLPDIASDDESDKIFGDLLLHLHPHYTECPWVSGGDDGEGPGGTGDGLGYILGEGDQLNLVVSFLLRREINTISKLHELIENVWKQDKMHQFYLMPLFIFFAQTVVSYIHHDHAFFEP